MDTQTQVERLIELAIIQRAELKRLVDELPALKEHLNAEVERTFEQAEPQIRAEIEQFAIKVSGDQNAKLGAELEGKIAKLAEALQVSAQAKFSAVLAEREKNAELLKLAESKIADAAASLPASVKDIVAGELSRFPRADQIDQLRKEFAEPRGLNPRGKWSSSETYQKLDLVSYNGDSYVSNTNDNKERPNRASEAWTLNAARGLAGGGGIGSLNELVKAPVDSQILGSFNGSYTPKTLEAGTGVTITQTVDTILIDAAGSSGGQTLSVTVYNAQGSTLSKGQVVYLYQATGGTPSVKLASNTSQSTSDKTIGVVSDSTIAAGATGTVMCQGNVSGLNLGAYTDGQIVYLDSTAGGITATQPAAPAHLVVVGIIGRANAGNGILYVKIQNGFELNQIHDVSITTPVAAGSTLFYDATNSVWKNAQLTAGTNIAVTYGDAASTVSITGTIPVANGGTGANTLTGYLKGNGTSAFTAVATIPGSAISGNISGSAANVTGTVAVGNGGSGATSLTGYLKGNGTSAFSAVATISGADISGNISGNSANVTGTVAIANGGTGASTTAGALTNLGIGTMGTQSSSSVSVTGGAIANVKVIDLIEDGTVSATAATGAINFDAKTQSVLYYTTNASATWTLNIRGDSGTSLDSMMATGDAMTVAFLVTQAATTYYCTQVSVDGSVATPKWQGGTAPTSGNQSGIDAYTYTVIKTASATFTVLAAQTQYK